MLCTLMFFFFFSSRRRHTRCSRDWSSDVCSSDLVKRWVEKKIRRHLMRARGRRGFGWKRWSSQWLYTTLGLFNNYRVVYRANRDRKSTRLNSSHGYISYAVFCLKKKKKID